MNEHSRMSGRTISHLANGLYRRWVMARRLKCSEETVAVFADALDAANRIDLRILHARRARQGGAS